MDNTELNTALMSALENHDNQELINQAYIILLRSELIMPVHKSEDYQEGDGTEPFSPFAMTGEEIGQNQVFVPFFSCSDAYKTWAGEHLNEIYTIGITGYELISNISPEVNLCLNAGGQPFKVFTPDEILFLKGIVAKTQKK